jgi:hypothetical protein
VACVPTAGSARIAFVSSAEYTAPQIASAANADSLCQGLANAVGGSLAGKTFKAWISDDSSSPSTRFTQQGSFVNMAGQTVASDWCVLTSTNDLTNQISTTEQGGASPSSGVWTGTNTNGTLASDCDNWTAAGSGTTGRDLNSLNAWSNAGGDNCALGFSFPIYCFEQ